MINFKLAILLIGETFMLL